MSLQVDEDDGGRRLDLEVGVDLEVGGFGFCVREGYY